MSCDYSNSEIEWARSQGLIGKISRALILGYDKDESSQAADMLRPLDVSEIVDLSDPDQFLQTCSVLQPQLLIIHQADNSMVGIDQVKRLRQCSLSCRRAAIVLTTKTPTVQTIAAAQDAGVHEFLRSPYEVRDLYLRLAAMFNRPRSWVESDSYVGPSRRSRSRAA